MASFDLARQRVCVRVVYDGVGNAGKTTNVRQLRALFPAKQASDVVSPSELRGRTLSFDWLEIRAGVVAGFPMICQVVSVPGQKAMAARRKQLLERADVVVVVADSARSEIERTRQSLEVLRSLGRSAPIVLQANKQDQVGAMSGAELAAALGLDLGPDPTAVVEAIACDGAGVVDTFVTAVRAVARVIKQRIGAGEIRIAVRPVGDAAALLATLSRDLDVDSASEMLLTELSEAMRPATTAALPPVSFESPPEIAALTHEDEVLLPTASVPHGYVWPAHTGRQILADLRVDRSKVSRGESARGITVGDHFLRALAHFGDAEGARAAIVRAARARTQLGAMLPADTVLALQTNGDGSCTLWSLHRASSTLAVAATRADPLVVDRLATGAFELLSIADSQRLAVKISLEAFSDESRPRYLGDVELLEGEAVLPDLVALEGELRDRGLYQRWIEVTGAARDPAL